MPAILFALVPLFGWGIGDILIVYITRRVGPYSTAIWGFLFRFLALSLLIPFFTKFLSNLTPDIFLLNLILGALLLGGAVASYEAFRVASASLVGAVIASFPALTVLISTFVLKENINSFQIASVLIIFTGIILSTLNFNEIKKGEFITNKGIPLSMITMIMWGSYFAFIKIPVKEIGWFWPNYFSFLLFPLIFLYMKLRKIELHNPVRKNVFLPLVISVIILGAGDLAYNYAAGQGLISVVAPIAGSFPVLFVLLAFLIFKDKITRQQILGIATTLVGIVLLSFFSV